ncbi:MAG: PGPGW domain-containing protein [Thermodesulfovibrionales bacterium]|nr:PGPGW domain-containing protein [Thermodesulfovibrionales bacterium]
MNILFRNGVKQTKRLIIAVVGFTVLAGGIAMIVLPGPAFIVITLGLGILAIEFVWARNLLKKVKCKLQRIKGGSCAGTRER